MDGRHSKRRKGSKGPKKSSQSRTSVDEVEEPQYAVPLAEKFHRSKKLNRHYEAPVSVASPSPEAEGSRTASSSHSPIGSTGKRSQGNNHPLPLRKLSKKRKAISEAAPNSSKTFSSADEDEINRAVSLQASSTEMNSKAKIDALEKENARLQEELAGKNGALEKQRETISYIYGQCTCTVCMELVWRPHVLAPCGHVFCARCLVAWFSKPASGESVLPQDHPNILQLERIRTLTRVKACPQCRERVTVAPVEVWLVKGLVDHIDKSMRDGQGNDDHLVQGQESLAGLSVPAIDEAKGANLPASPAIWKDIFDPHSRMDEPIYDEEDRVFRCNFCTSEVVNGQCTNPSCQMLFDVDGFLSGSDSMLDDEYSGESDDFDEDDLGFLDDGPIEVLDSEDEAQEMDHHSQRSDFDSVIFASGSDEGAIVISSESSDNDDEDNDRRLIDLDEGSDMSSSEGSWADQDI